MPYKMIGVADILQHIAQELSCYTAEELTPLVEGAPVDCPLDMHLCITNDIEGTELNYLLQYGQGHTLTILKQVIELRAFDVVGDAEVHIQGTIHRCSLNEGRQLLGCVARQLLGDVL